MLSKLFAIILFSLILALPVQAGVLVLNGLTHTYQIGENSYFKGVISLQNTSSSPQDVKLYKRDYSYQANGEMFYGDPSLNERTNADWIELSTTFLTLQGREKIDLIYEIQVPNESYLKNGTYWSVIIVEPVPHIYPSEQKKQFSITSVVRYAIQILTNYNTPNAASVLKFNDVKLNASEENNYLEVDIVNEGELFHKAKLHLELFDAAQGNLVGVFSTELQTLLPTTSKRFQVNMGDLPAGKYKAVLTADADNNMFGLQLDLFLEDD